MQLRAFDSSKSGSAVGVGVLLALCSSLLQKNLKGGLAVGTDIILDPNDPAVAEAARKNGVAPASSNPA